MAGIALTLIGIGTLLASVTLGGYPVSMVAADEEIRSNVSPPSVALLMLALAQLGIVIAAHRRLSRWLDRPRVWAVVVAAGSVTLTVYLWHMTAMTLVGSLTYLTGLWPHASAIDALWWVLRVPWLLLCALLLAIVVFLFRGFEVAVPIAGPAPVRTVIGLTSTLAGITQPDAELASTSSTSTCGGQRLAWRFVGDPARCAPKRSKPPHLSEEARRHRSTQPDSHAPSG